jgi:hypothetical protein
MCGSLHFCPHGCRFGGDQFCRRQGSELSCRSGQHQNGPVPGFGPASFQAFPKGDNATSAELARILERTWDAAEEGGGDRSLAKTNKDLFEQIDKAMDVFIKHELPLVNLPCSSMLERQPIVSQSPEPRL